MKRGSVPDVVVDPAFPALPGADKSGRVAIALDTCVLIPERIRVQRGDAWPLDSEVVKAHPKSFRPFVPPPLNP